MIENSPTPMFAEDHAIRAPGVLSLLMPHDSRIGVGVKSLDGRYLMANKAISDLLGNQVEIIEQLTDADLFPLEIAAGLERADQQIIEGAPVARNELTLLVNGVPTRYLSIKFPMLGVGGEKQSIGTVMFDITHQDEVAEMRQAMVKLQKKNDQLQKELLKLDHLASTDKLTGAWNRRRLEEAVISEMDRLERYDHPLSMLIIDIDFFKEINDDKGHVLGDQVLSKLVAQINASLRTIDSLTRWGGDEFVVMSPNTTLSTMAVLAERLREKIHRTAFPDDKNITVSIGVAECMAGESFEQWFNRADAALYRAKACGRNQVQISPDTPKRVGMGENVAASFVQLTWHAAYESGHALIDSQHRRLFDGANQLLSAILSGRPKDEVAVVIDRLIADVLQHFKDEEIIFTAAGFPGALEHAATHQELVARAVVLFEHFHAGTLVIGELFQFLAHDVVARHMLGADREFFPYLGK